MVTAVRPETPTFRSMPGAARAYVGIVVVAGAACLATAAWYLRIDQIGLFATLMVLAVGISAMKIELPLGRSQSNLSLSHAVNFWGLFALGPAETVFIAAIGAWAQCTLRVDERNPLYRVLFSIATLTVTVSIAALPAQLLAGSDPPSGAALIREAAVVGPLYFFANSALVAGAIALSTRQPVVGVWRRNFLWSAPSYLAGAALAAFATTASERGWFGWLALLVVPLYLVFRSYHTVVSRLREEQDQTRRAMDVQLSTIEALALAIDAAAGSTPEHLRSIQRYAAALGDAAGLSDAEVQGLRTAALLHDVGNMAVPEHILSKNEPLTPEEFERVKTHARVGAEILRDVPFDAPVADLVLSHHERWDGLGYPAGLRGTSIPLGARILAIADCYSTLQTDRPYRPARSEAEAAAVLREFSGTSFDPTLVDLFMTRVATVPTPVVEASPDAAHATRGMDVLQNIVGTHREEQTLYEIAQALGSSLDVDGAMTVIQDKARLLVPFVTCALFLGDDRDGYTCRYASGPGTEALLKSGHRSWSDISHQLPSNADGRGAFGEELTSLLPRALTFGGRLIGGLVLYHTVPDSFTDEHRRVFGRIGEQIAAVIVNSTRFEQTELDSHTDALTGLANRRSLDRQFGAGLERAEQASGNISVIVLDLDRLKHINDTFGHEAGDRALRAVGNVLRATVRKNDLCARFAGDEYVVLLWDCSADYERRRVLDIQAAVGKYPFEPRPGVCVSLSISAGVARYPVDGHTFDELLATADERMYQDKAARRGRGAGRLP